MKPMNTTTTFKRVADNGQISIGKEWAGKFVQVVSSPAGVEIIPGEFVPESQKVFYTKEAQEQLSAFDEWASKKSAKKTDLKELKKKLGVKKK